jgi:hypothetical protein
MRGAKRGGAILHWWRKRRQARIASDVLVDENGDTLTDEDGRELGE